LAQPADSFKGAIPGRSFFEHSADQKAPSISTHGLSR